MSSILDVNLTFMIVSFIIGIVLALISIAIGNNWVKVIVFLAGFLPIVAVLFGFISSTNSAGFNVTIQQTVDRVNDLVMYSVNVVVPYLVGVILSNAGEEFIDNLFGQGRKRGRG